jgi:hypothetical protein
LGAAKTDVAASGKGIVIVAAQSAVGSAIGSRARDARCIFKVIILAKLADGWTGDSGAGHTFGGKYPSDAVGTLVGVGCLLAEGAGAVDYGVSRT